jgi:hypothetical protein
MPKKRAALARPGGYAATVNMLAAARDQVDRELLKAATGDNCPNDTDGDGDCGQPACPHCGSQRHIAEIADNGSGKEAMNET